MYRTPSSLSDGKTGARGILAGAACLALASITSFSILSAGSTQAVAAEGRSLLQADSFASLESAAAQGWEQYSQREEIRPEFFTAAAPSLGGAGSLGLYGASNAVERGSWRKQVTGVKAGGYYRFEAVYQAHGVDNCHQKVFARLEWRDSKGEMIGHQRDYAAETDVEGQWQNVAGTFRAPEGTQSVLVELVLSQSPQGSAWWDRISLAEVPAPPKRPVRLATVDCRPSSMTDSRQSVEEICGVAEQAGKQGADIVCLGEGINLVGIPGATYTSIAEPIPGPTTRRLGELARKYHMYVVAALGERENQALYNTAVLIDRQGELAAKYRKVYIPEGEFDQGCAQGNLYPVFDTDFGRIGLLICWDSWFVDPARALALQGAEIIFLPIWGGNQTLMRARAIENHIYLVSSGYDVPSNIYNPWGDELAVAKRPGVAVAGIDLNYPPPCPWPWPLGDTRQVLMQARRTDIRLTEFER